MRVPHLCPDRLCPVSRNPLSRRKESRFHPCPAPDTARVGSASHVAQGRRRTLLREPAAPGYLRDPPQPPEVQPWGSAGHPQRLQNQELVSPFLRIRGAGANLCPPAVPLKGKPLRKKQEGSPNPPPPQPQAPPEEDGPGTSSREEAGAGRGRRVGAAGGCQLQPGMQLRSS